MNQVISRLTFKFTSLFLLLLMSFGAMSQDLTEAWKSFYGNDRKKAVELFSSALKSNPNCDEAYLGLALTTNVDKPRKEVIKNIIDFYSKSKNPAPYLAALWSPFFAVSTDVEKSSEEVAFLKMLATQKGIDGYINANANLALIKHLTYKQDGDVQDYIKNVGSVAKWKMAGEFENISSSGYDKEYDPIKQPDNSAAFTNKVGAKVKWFDIPGIRYDQWIDLEFYFTFTHNSIEYAQTFVVSDKPQKAQLRIGVSGSLKVWVNDKLVLAESDERNNGVDSYITEVDLNAGANRVLVQIGESYCNNSNFMLRFTDSNGQLLPNLTYTTDVKPYQKASGGESPRIDGFAEKFFKDKIKENPKDMLSQLMLANLYLGTDRTEEARGLLTKLQESNPKSSYILSLLYELYQRSDNRTLSTMVKEEIKDADPTHPLTLIGNFDEAVSRNNVQEVSTAVDKIEEVLGANSLTTIKRRIQQASINKEQMKLVDLIEKSYKQYPNDGELVDLKALVEKQVRNNEQASIDVYKTYIKQNLDYSRFKELAEVYSTKGNGAEAIKIYESFLKEQPIANNALRMQANISYSSLDYKKALEYFRKALLITPQSSSLYYQIGLTQRHMNDTKGAMESFNRSVELNPANFEAIKELRELDKKKDIYNYFETTEANVLLKSAPTSKDLPDDGSVIVNAETQKVVYKSGVTEERRFLLVKILNTSGIENWKELNLSGYNNEITTLEKAEVIKANGTRVEAETNDLNIVFTNLEVGDGINVIYKVKSNNEGKLINHFWDKVYFQRYVPCQHIKYSLLVADGLKFDYKVINGSVDFKQSKADEFTKYDWSANNTPAVKEESRMPSLSDIAPSLFVSSIPSWDFISKWYYDIASCKAKPDFDVKKVAKSLFADGQKYTDMEKVKIIFRYIQKNITYSSVSFRQSGIIPQRPSAVINTRIGDCKDMATLFVSLCKEVGVSADLVLVNTRDNGMNDLVLPTIDFNHCIAKYVSNGKTYYLDLTSNTMPFGGFYPNQINSQYLDITDNSVVSTLGHLNPSGYIPADGVVSTSIVLEDKSLNIKEKAVFTGGAVAAVKSMYFEKSENEIQKTISEQIGAEYSNFQIKSVDIKGLEVGIDTVNSTISYVLNDMCNEVAGMEIFTIPWSFKAKAQDYNMKDGRLYPIDNASSFYLNNTTEVLKITFPKDMALVEIPKNVSYSCNAADYSLSYKMVGDVLECTRIYKIKQQVIPLVEVKDFYDFYRKVINTDSKQLAIKQK